MRQGFVSLANSSNVRSASKSATSFDLSDTAFTPQFRDRPFSIWRRRASHHIVCGYLAGLHSYKPATAKSQVGDGSAEEEPKQHADFDSFETAWEAVTLVPRELLDDFEAEIWESQSRKFVYGTKYVSVIDAAEQLSSGVHGKDSKERFFRYLIWNERPNLIQTAVEIPSMGAPYRHYYRRNNRWVPRSPSPVSETHLGGLAMVLPLWKTLNISRIPHCVVIGAGGCSLAHTMGANLRDWNANSPESVSRRSFLTAIEPSREVVEAARLWFGAGDGDDGPSMFDLVCDTGESYLRSLSRNCENDPVDVLVVDAEDGTAPPLSMQTQEFWTNTVIPAVNFHKGAVVGVNVIGSEVEISNLVNTLRTAFSNNYKVLVVSPPSEADVSNRHKLVFVVPMEVPSNDLLLSRDQLKDCVDLPGAWQQQLWYAVHEQITTEPRA